MSDPASPSVNRRTLARSALLGGVAAVFSSAAFADRPAPTHQDLLNARHFGATGDGQTDDTAALQRALDAAGEKASAVFLPPGVYRTRELHLRPGISLIGIPGWNYSGPGGGTILHLGSADATCLLNLTGARGATIDGLTLDGLNLGHNTHGISVDRIHFAEHEDSFRIERCQVAHFTGDALHFSCVWCFSVRHCMLGHNGGDGLSLRGWDGFILDNWFSDNGRAGFAAREENDSVTFTANRIEWNRQENMTIAGADGYQITGNFFDRAGTIGLALRKQGQRPCSQFTITGNYFKRSGRFATADTDDSAQLLLDGATGVTCSGNSFWAGRDDDDHGVWSPSYGIIVQGLEDCILANNVLYHGALRQLLVDHGGHGDGVIIKDNPGRLFHPPAS
jgi:predicted dehydrogenase